jgi:hypothetical protein
MSTSLPPDLRAKILAAARNEPSPTRARTLRAAAIAIALGYALSLVLFIAFGGAETTLRPVSLIVTTAAGWSAVALACTWGAFGRGRSMLGRSRELLVAIVVAVAPLLLAWAVLWTSVLPTPDLHPGASLHIKCFRATLALALGPFIAFMFVRRASDPVHPRATGAAIGAAAGAWGSVMIDLHCPASTAEHIALGHVLPTLGLAAIGAWLGQRVLGVRGEGGRVGPSPR